MEIVVQRINQAVITLEFIQDLEQSVDDITPFIKSLEKIKKIVNKIGYGNKFNKEERELWNNIFEQLLEVEKPNGINNYGEDKHPVDE